MMFVERLCQRRIAWIPWVLAVVALLGINALCRDDSPVRRNDTVDGVGLSVAAKDLWYSRACFRSADIWSATTANQHDLSSSGIDVREAGSWR